jgi:hypothetical protein
MDKKKDQEEIRKLVDNEPNPEEYGYSEDKILVDPEFIGDEIILHFSIWQILLKVDGTWEFNKGKEE